MLRGGWVREVGGKSERRMDRAGENIRVRFVVVEVLW